MKRRTLFVILIFSTMFVLYLNQMLLLEYDTNIVEYIYYSLPQGEAEADYLKTRDHLIYGGNINEPPLGIEDSETGQSLGLVVDYMNAISIQIGVPIVSKPMIWNEALVALSEGETDLCDMIPSEERSRRFDFSKPLYDLKGVIVVKGSTDQGVNKYHLEDKVIAAQRGDYAIEVIRKFNKRVTIIEVDNVSDALNLLESAQVDAVVGDEPVIWYYINELPVMNNMTVIREPIYELSCSVAVPKGEKELLNVMNRAIFELRRNGTLQKINDKWMGYSLLLNENTDAEKLRTGLFMLTGFLGIVIVLIVLGNRRLNSIIAYKTRELQFTFDSLNSLMVVLNEEKCIVNINQAFLKFVEMERDSVLGKHYTAFEILEKAFKGESVFQFGGNLYELKTQDNRIIMIRDITYEKIKEQQLIHNNRMEAIGQLASGVAHELRNPLGVMRNSTYLLKDVLETPNQLTDRAISSIDASIERASLIIDNLLNFSRIGAGSAKCVRVCDLLEETIEYFRGSTKYKEIQFKLNRGVLASGEEITFVTNENSLRHIVINLLSNACDAIEERGEIEVGCSIDVKEGEDELTVQVCDSGRGIEEAEMERLFDPFYTTKPPGEGTGLGLYIVYTELKKINGYIHINSQKAQGTCFTVTLKSIHGDSNGGQNEDSNDR